MLNREVGVKPTRSRRCNAEQASKMPLGNWEGGVSNEAESEELPDVSISIACE